MFTLKLAKHEFKPGENIFEIWNGEILMGTIYPTEKGIKIVSKFIAADPEAAISIDRSKLPPIPAILINIIK